MAILPVLHYPDDRLRTVARLVTNFNSSLIDFVGDLSETMYEEGGIGLAATQVDRHIRVLAVDISEGCNDLKIFVNPEIIKVSEVCLTKEEGCLSLPDQLVKVSRPESIFVRAFDQYGQLFELTANGLLAVCIQHEMDHLDGRLIFDHLSLIKQQLYREKRVKQNRKMRKDGPSN